MSGIAFIKNFMLQFAYGGPAFTSPNPSVPVQLPLTFSAVQSLNVKEGIYTPNNDYEWIWKDIPPSDAPNFIFLQTPAALNLSITLPGGILLCNAVPVNKVSLLCLPPGVTPDNIYIEGRLAQSPTPMPQGQPVPFFCFMAQATF